MRRKTQLGVSLFELLLVFMILIGISVLVLNQFANYRRSADLSALQYNVDQLFQALQGYYEANCFGTYTAATSGTGPTFTAGALNPASGTQITQSYGQLLMDATPTLVTDGFLNASDWHPANPLLGNGSTPNTSTAYVVQFNPYPPSTQGVTVNACTNYPTSTSSQPGMSGCAAYSQTQTSSLVSNNSNVKIEVVTWASQVAVELPTATTLAQAQSYMNALNADCISTLNGSTVTPCSKNPTPKSPYYLVWQRIPSYSSSSTMSPISKMWQTLPTLKQFNYMNTHDQFLEMQGYGSTGSGATNYYLCGG